MKWNSPIVGRLINQLAKSIVGSVWRGRNYFRNYVIPSNPKTLSQTAFREVHRLAVSFWQQTHKPEDDALEAWNKLGNKSRFSGFNAYIQKVRRSSIHLEILEPVGPTQPINVHYFVGIDWSDTYLVRSKDGGEWTILKNIFELKYKQDDYFEDILTEAGEYDYYLASNFVAQHLTIEPIAKSVHCHWNADTANGDADRARITIGASPPPECGGMSILDEIYIFPEEIVYWEFVNGCFTGQPPSAPSTKQTQNVEVLYDPLDHSKHRTLYFENGLFTGSSTDPLPSGLYEIVRWDNSQVIYEFIDGVFTQIF